MTKRSRIAIATACSAAALSILMAPAAFAANTAQNNGATATTAAHPTAHKKMSKHAKKTHHAKATHAAAPTMPTTSAKK